MSWFSNWVNGDFSNEYERAAHQKDRRERTSGSSWLTKLVALFNNAFNPYHDWMDYENNSFDNLADKTFGTGLTSAEQAANEFSAAEAQKNRDWQEYMTRNKYQMETESMQAAGINPAMMYGGGNLVSTAANGSAPSSVQPESGSAIGPLLSLIMSMVRFPKEMDALKAQIDETKSTAQMNRDLGQAALENAASNRRNAGVQERLATVAEYRADIENELKDWNIKVSAKEIDEIAERARNLAENTRLMERNVAAAEKNASANEKSALAAVRNSLANMMDAQTRKSLAPAQKALLEAQEVLTSLEGDARDTINKYLDEKTKHEVENIEKEGLRLDKQGRLLDKHGNLATAQQVFLYVNAACNVSREINGWINPLARLQIKNRPDVPQNPTPISPDMLYGNYGTDYLGTY